MGKNKMIFGERRLYERKTCLFTVDLNDHKKSYACNLRDLSLGGALLEYPSHFKPVLGKELFLNISYRNRPGKVMIKGHVIRYQPGQLAMVFEKTMAASLHQAA